MTATERAKQRLWVRAAVGSLAALTLLAAIAWVQSTRAPAWWSRALPPPDAADLASRVERAVVAEAHKGRPDAEPWTIAITQDQANAWLTERLPRWLSNAGKPDALNAALAMDAAHAPAHPAPPAVRLRFADALVSIGARIQGGRIASASIRTPRAAAAPPQSLAPPSIRLGRLPVPRAWAADALPPAQEGAEFLAVVRSFLTSDLPDAPLELPLEDGRRIRLLGLRAENARLIATFATHRAESARAH